MSFDELVPYIQQKKVSIEGEEYSAIDISVVPSMYSNSSKLTLSWELLSFDTKQMEFQIYFDEPDFISSEEDPEILKIVIND